LGKISVTLKQYEKTFIWKHASLSPRWASATFLKRHMNGKFGYEGEIPSKSQNPKWRIS